MTESGTNQQNKGSKDSSNGMNWWQLSLIGIGCTIGTGFFLGSSIGILQAGPLIILAFLLAATGTYFIYGLLAEMTALDPQEGSFCTYAGKAFGRWASFSSGWNYWCSNVLVMGSQLIALATLTQYWFPNIELWMLAALYASLATGILFLGTGGFDKAEDVFAIIKIAAIFMFIIFGVLLLSGMIDIERQPNSIGSSFFLKGLTGLITSLLFAYYAFGGIEVIGMMAVRLKNTADAAKAGKIMIVLLAIIYIASLSLAVLLVPLSRFNTNESPFMTVFRMFDLPILLHLFNGAIIIAGFSTMTAVLYSVTNLLLNLAKDKEAPSMFAKRSEHFKGLPLHSLVLSVIGLSISVVAALLLPGKVYEYITTAAGILLLYNWVFITASSFKLLTGSLRVYGSGITGLLLIICAIIGTVVEPTLRPGFYISMAVVLLISAITWKVHK
ncbi:amino acid permease [Thalassobacillus hwangdonensis]|uniref:Amino acid permease n=1 Tax=Thalassobacillus hwangdonensis TaxID=546108 RepID=A0ABW3KYP3_9BACI